LSYRDMERAPPDYYNCGPTTTTGGRCA